MEEIKLKHWVAGKSVGLRTGPNGEYFIKFLIHNEDNDKQLVAEFLIDTGFNGYLQISDDIAQQLDLKIINKIPCTLADGTIKEVGISKSKVTMLDLEVKDVPIQIDKNGVLLVGTSLLKNTGIMLIADCSSGYITLTFNKTIKEQVREVVDKYADNLNYYKKLENKIDIEAPIICLDCKNKIDFPYKKGRIISPRGCSFIADIGEDNVTINDGHSISGCPDLELFRNIKIKCKCGNLIFNKEKIN